MLRMYSARRGRRLCTLRPSGLNSIVLKCSIRAAAPVRKYWPRTLMRVGIETAVPTAGKKVCCRKEAAFGSSCRDVLFQKRGSELRRGLGVARATVPCSDKRTRAQSLCVQSRSVPHIGNEPARMGRARMRPNQGFIALIEIGLKASLRQVIKPSGSSANSDLHAPHVTALAAANSSGAKVEQTRPPLLSERPR